MTDEHREFTLEHVIAAQVNRDQAPKPCPEWFRKAIEEARERIDTKETM